VPRGGVVVAGDVSLYLDCRGAGSPTVVLESGAGSGAAQWSAIHDQVATLSRTCAYDRAGIGASKARGPHTLAESAADLRAVLEAAGERRPFVIVGHSLGGAYARVFAAEHRDATAALVLLDSFDPDLQTDFVHPLLGDLVPEYEAGLDGLRRTVEAWEALDWRGSERELRGGDLDGLRIAVLVARRVEPRLDEATNVRIRDAWRTAFERLSPGRVTYEYADGSGHVIPADRPDLVVELIRRVVAEVRAGR
jgi:pimeloyl-ACP methyl ester carboxylesterase